MKCAGVDGSRNERSEENFVVLLKNIHNYQNMLPSNRSFADDNKTHWNRERLTGKAVATAERGPAVNVAYGIIAVLSFTSNLVFCLAMSTRRRRSLKTLHDQLILTLAVADAFTGKKTVVTIVTELPSVHK